jgi:hypothetical protein
VIFYRHAISDQGFDPILFHSSGGVGDELMSIVEPNAVTGVGQYLGYETLELQLLGHAMFLDIAQGGHLLAVAQRGDFNGFYFVVNGTPRLGGAS